MGRSLYPSVPEVVKVLWWVPEQAFEGSLTIGEGAAKLSPDKGGLRYSAQQTETDLVPNDVAYRCPVNSITHFGRKFMPVVKTLERALLLRVGEVVIPLEFGNNCDPLHPEGQKWS